MRVALRLLFDGAIMHYFCLSGLYCWDTQIDLKRFPVLKDHALIQGGPVMPGAAYLEMAFAMTLDKFACQAMELKNVSLSSLLTLPETQVRSLRLRLLTGQTADGAEFEISSVQEDRTELLLSRGKVSVDLLSKTGEKRTGTMASHPVVLFLWTKVILHAVTMKLGDLLVQIMHYLKFFELFWT